MGRRSAVRVKPEIDSHRPTVPTGFETTVEARNTLRAAGRGAGGLIGDSAVMAGAVALSRLTGFLRIVVAASILGSTVMGDLFVAVNVLPLTLYDVFAGSAISSVLVPPLVRFLDRRRIDLARRFTANAVGIITVAMATVAAGAMLGRSVIAGALTAGVEPDLSDDAAAVGAVLVLLIVPQLVLYAAIGVFVSIQHATRRFLVPSVAPTVENLGLLATIGVAWFRYGGGIEVDRVPLGLVVTLGVGSGLSVGAHALVQFLAARRALGSFGFGLDWRDREFRALAGPTRASFGWSTIIAARQFALVVAAGFAGAGGVQAFEIATLVYFIPVALIGRPIASAALPRMAASGTGAAGRLAGYRSTIRLAAWIAVPVGVALVTLSGPLADVVGQGRFAGEDARRMLAFGLAGLGIGAAAEALFEIARQATMAHGRGALVASTWLRAGVAVVGIPLVTVALDGPSVLLGLGLVVSGGDVAALAIAHRGLRRDPSWPDPAETSHWPRLAVASAAATVPFAIGGHILDIAWTPLSFLALAVGVGLTLLVAVWLVTDRGRLLRSITTALNNEGLA